MYVCVCRKVSSKTGSTISMQDRLATDQVQPSQPRPLAPHSCFSCRPHDFGVSCSVTSAEGHKHSHFSLHSFVTVGTTALCRSLIMLSFVLALDSFFLSFIVRHSLSLSLSQPLHLPIPLTSNPPRTFPPHLDHPPLSCLPLFIFSLVLSPPVPVIGCRSLTILMKSGGRWVINHLQTSVCVRVYVCVCIMCI